MGSILGIAEGVQDGIEIVDPGVLDDDPSLASPVFNGDLQAKAAAQLLLGVAHIGVEHLDRLFRLGLALRVQQALHHAFRCTHIQAKADDPLRRGADHLRRG